MTMKIQEIVLVLLLLCMKPGHIKSQSDDCSFCRSIKFPLEMYQKHYHYNYPKPALVKDLPSPPILNQGKCGVSKNDQSQQIVGGDDAQVNAWTWQVFLSISGSLCGGVIINSEWIVTAGHCADSRVAKVSYGNNNYRKANTTSTKAMFISIERHVDMALYKLSSPLTFTDSVQPVCLPEGNIWDASPCFITAWGSTVFLSNTPSDSLKQLRVRILDQTIAYHSFYGIIDSKSSNFCFTSSGYSGISRGDSGSALTCLMNGRYYLVGEITHFLPFDGYFIGSAASVPKNIQWITDTIRINS